MKFSYNTSKAVTVILHILAWIILFIFPSYILYIESGNDQVFLDRTIIQVLLFIAVFYTNYLWLAPRLFIKRRKLLYFFAAVSLVVASTAMNEISFKNIENREPDGRLDPLMLPPFKPTPGVQVLPKEAHPETRKRPPRNWSMYNFLMTTVFISGLGMGLSISDKFRKNEKMRKESEKQKLSTELAFLKNQINPHFFFNTLNNIYSLVQTNVDDGQKAILQLSKLMRYLLYETEKGDKMLSQEIDFMRTYIELMRLRISEKVELTIRFPEGYHDVTLPPLLFLPFIENAFKHGISYRRPSFVNVMLNVDGGKIVFECSNSIGNKGEDLLRSDYGIGLENVKKRLALLFPGHHELKIEETESAFSIVLQIDIP